MTHPERKFVYAILAPDAHTIKIGLSYEPERRMRAFEESHSVPLQLLAKMAGDRRDEQDIHYRLRLHRLSGEWFRECPEVLAIVDEIKARTEGRALAARKRRTGLIEDPDVGVTELCSSGIVAARSEWMSA